MNVGTINNTAQATIHSEPTADGWQAATLDGLRVTRDRLGRPYPFLTRFDEYIPLSWGELVDSIRNEGPEAVTKYLTSTMGLKEAFFNTWVASTAEAEEVSIAASVNILVENNVSEAVVESGVRINQDQAWRDDGSTAPDQDNSPATVSDLVFDRVAGDRTRSRAVRGAGSTTASGRAEDRHQRHGHNDEVTISASVTRTDLRRRRAHRRNQRRHHRIH